MNWAGDQPQRDLDSDYALEVWHRRRWVAVAVFLAAFAGMARGALSLPDLYRTSATVLVSGQEVSEAYVKTSITAELETRIQTIQQQVMSRGSLRDMIIQLGLHPEFGSDIPDSVIQRMRRDIVLELKSVPGTYRNSTISFTLTYSGRDPESVVLVTNTLAERYVQENTESRTGQAARTVEFLAAQLADVKRQLDAQEQQASEFKLLHAGGLPGELLVTLSSLERVYSKLRTNTDQQSRTIELRDRLEQQLADVAAEGVVPTPAGPSGRGQLATLRQELVELRRQFTTEHPDVIRVTAQIAALERQSASAATNGHPDAPVTIPATAAPDATGRGRRGLANADAQLRSLQEEEAVLRQTIANYESRIEESPRLQQEFQQLSGEYEITKTRYATLLNRYEEAQLADTLEQGQTGEQFRILDAAIPPTGPAAPNRTQLLLMGLLGSLALAFGAVVAAERLDTTFHRVDDLRAFVNMRTVVTIHLIPTQAAARRRRGQFAFKTVMFVLALALIVAGAHYFASGNEQLLRLVARVG